MDPQGRIVIPQKLRDVSEQGVVLARGIELCVEVYPLTEWEQYKQVFATLSHFDANARLAGRLIFSSAFNAVPDRQGRVVLPQDLRSYAGIAEDVVMSGHDNYFEIWSPDKWRLQEARAADLVSIAEMLEKGRG